MEIRGIDVSSYQGKPDWAKVKGSGVKFAIIRILNSKGVDPSFEHNYAKCVENGIAKGVYRFCYALNVDQARKEAREVLETLNGRYLEMGVWLDLEWSKLRALGSAKVKEIAKAWMQVIRDAGYECNIYCNRDWFKNVCGGLDAEYWVARYPIEDNGTMKSSLKPNVGEIGWQYSSKGRVPGISGNVDMDVWYGELVVMTPEEEPLFDEEAVGSLQEALNADGITDKNGEQLKVDKKKGELTESAIKKVLLKSGAFDEARCRYLVGSTGEVVKWLQMRLNTVIGNNIIELLGEALEPDGKLGTDTRLAIGLFQEMKGLDLDYIAGINTITELLKIA